MKISICIPVHPMKNAKFFLERALNSIYVQTFEDYEVIVTDNSDNGVLEEVCAKNNVLHSFNERKGMAQNTNEAIKLAEGELVKILYMDDFFAHTTALQKIVDNFEGEWLVTGCNHSNGKEILDNHPAEWDERIMQGINTIGSPSVLTMRNETALYFDENLTWLLDVDLYQRLGLKYGDPKILRDINVTIGLHEGQLTNLLSDELKASEAVYLTNKK